MATRAQLEHAIRAATTIVSHDRILIIGSQSVLGTWSEGDLPPEAVESIEFDACPLNDDDAESLATLLDGVAGEWSPFHDLHGFYIQGVGRRTAVLPPGWPQRLVAVRNENTQGRVGLCLEPHDLCAAKLFAGREKDHVFVDSLVRAQLIDPHRVTALVSSTAVADPAARDRALTFLGQYPPRPPTQQKFPGLGPPTFGVPEPGVGPKPLA